MNRFIIVLMLSTLVGGCTSTGHEARAVPQVTKSVKVTSPVILDGDDGALSLAVESILEHQGIDTIIPTSVGVKEFKDNKEFTYTESAARFVVRVRSVDLDSCLPEGSRQMHFRITVYDLTQRKRVYLTNGEFGCRNTIVRHFSNWIQVNQH